MKITAQFYDGHESGWVTVGSIEVSTVDELIAGLHRIKRLYPNNNYYVDGYTYNYFADLKEAFNENLTVSS